MKKLDDKRYGPFNVIAKYRKSYYLQLLQRWKTTSMHDVFYVSLLSLYQGVKHPKQTKLKEPRPLQQSSKIYKVEKVLDSRLGENGLKYLVKWSGFSKVENT